MIKRPQCKAVTITVALCGALLLAVVGGVLDSIAPHGIGGLLIRMPAFAVAVGLVLVGFNALCDCYERWLDIPTDRNRVTSFHEFTPSEFERRELNEYRYKQAAAWPKAKGDFAAQPSSASPAAALASSARSKTQPAPAKQWVGQ